MKIRTQLLVIFAALALLPLLAAGLVVYRTGQARLLAQSDENLATLTRLVASEVEAFVRHAVDDARTDGLLPTFPPYLATDLARRQAPDGRLNNLLATATGIDPVNITSCALFDRLGAKLIDTDPALLPLDESRRSWVTVPLLSGLTAAVPDFPAAGRPALWISAPVRLSSGAIIGVLRLRYELTALQQIVARASTGAGAMAAFAAIVDDQGRILAHGEDAGLVGRTAPAFPAVAARDPTATTGPAVWSQFGRAQTEPDRVGVLTLSNVPWRVVFVSAGPLYRRATDELFLGIVELSLLLVLLGAVAAITAAARFSGPIAKLAAAAARIGHGELTGELPVAGAGEVAMLTRTFNRMTADLRDTLGQLNRRIAELHRTEQALRASERQLTEIVDHTTDIIFLLRVEPGPRFVYERINRALDRHGLSTAAFTGGEKTARDLFLPATAEAFEVDYRACLAARTPVVTEQHVALPAGQTVFQTTLVPVIDETGAVARMVGFAHDVTLEHRQQAMLEQTQQIARVGGWEIDCSNNSVTWTRATYAIHDLTPETYRPSIETGIGFYLEEDGPRIRAAVEEALRGDGAYDLSLRLRTAAGRIVPVRTLARIEQRDGRPVRIVGAIFDLTELTRAEQEVRRLNAELEQRVADRTAQLAAANAELESFSYSVSHDLRAPLRAIDGFSRAVQEDYGPLLDDAGRDGLRRIRGASQRMGRLIDDLLKLAQVSRGELHRESLDLSALAAEIAAELRTREPARAVEFVCAPGLRAHADRNLTRIALENLLDNAWKYTRRQPAPRIVFGALAAAGPAAFFIEDNGAGFDPRYAAKLFGAFQRLHTAADFEGTGIGLATVRRIVTRHGGRIWAESAAGRGAKFCFILEPSPL